MSNSPPIFKPQKRPVRSCQIGVRFTPEEYERITAAAEKADIPVREFIVQALDFAIANLEINRSKP